MKQPKILVVGSFVMDQIVTTNIFPRQGQTILANTFQKAPGGKGANQAVQMARLGAHVTMCGKLGRDANGKEMLAVLNNTGVDTTHVAYDDKQSSGCAVIILEEHPGHSAENRIMVVPGANMTITPEDIAFLENDITQFDLVVLQLEIPMDINVKVAQYAKKQNIPVMLNSAPSAAIPTELLECLTYISPNEHEAFDLTGIEIPHSDEHVDLDAAQNAAKALQQKGVENVLITLGSAGAIFVGKDSFAYNPAVQNVQAVDPTAAGDSFVGAFCVASCCGLDPQDALLFANHTAAITVSHMGAMPSLPTLDIVNKALSKSEAAFKLEVFA